MIQASARAAALIALAAACAAWAEMSTVCTITVNSTDEREAFRRHLPGERFRFVELVERGRPDWLASACRQQVRCDVLVVSGHFAGREFYSSRFDVAESLPVDEMERVACGDGCPGLPRVEAERIARGLSERHGESSRERMRRVFAGMLRRHRLPAPGRTDLVELAVRKLSSI